MLLSERLAIVVIGGAQDDLSLEVSHEGTILESLVPSRLHYFGVACKSILRDSCRLLLKHRIEVSWRTHDMYDICTNPRFQL